MSKKKKEKKSKNKEKQKNEVEEPRAVAPPTPRIIWKVEHETELLKCMAAFIASTGLDPYKDAEALRSFAKESECPLPEASAYQLKEKIRRMRRKFAQGSGGHNFTELASKVWEPEKNAAGGKESRFEEENNNKKGSKRVLFEEPEQEQEQEHDLKGGKRVQSVEPEREEEEEQGDEVDLKLKGIVANWSEVLGSCMPGMSEEGLNRALRLIEGSKRAELEKKWEELKMAELELFVKRAELIRDQARLMLEASKSSKPSN